MQLADYWMPRPEPAPDRATSDRFDRLLDQALERGPAEPIGDEIGAPTWQFLCHAADRADLVLHGSGDPDISRFEPRQPDDSMEFSGRRAVFAATDGLWPMYFAILDRSQPMLMINACVRVGTADQPGPPHYFFSISRPALEREPWRTGTVYLLPAATFDHQPPVAAGDSWIHIAQAASPVAVEPVAKITVAPDDFPFLHQIRGHDDAEIADRAAADPDGFPWAEPG